MECGYRGIKFKLHAVQIDMMGQMACHAATPLLLGVRDRNTSGKPAKAARASASVWAVVDTVRMRGSSATRQPCAASRKVNILDVVRVGIVAMMAASEFDRYSLPTRGSNLMAVARAGLELPANPEETGQPEGRPARATITQQTPPTR
ncbi:hypothetical protein A7D02_21835 [Aeromonas salmonicida]|nr:hypothetical protein A7D02_21835 [Aeromonas salmonicida]